MTGRFAVRRADRRFGMALAASILLHFLLVAAPGWQPPGDAEVRSVRIEARLLPPPRIAAVAEQPVRETKPAPAPRPRSRPAPRSRPVPRPIVPRAPPPQALIRAPQGDTQAPAAAPGEAAPVPDQGEAPGAEQGAAPSAGSASGRPSPGPATENVFPEQGRIVFSAIRGAGYLVGTAEADWRTQGDRYHFGLRLQTIGLVALFKRLTLEYSSDGRIGANGFVPLSYTQDENGEPKEAAAFDWERRRLTIASPRGHAAFDLMEASQDLVSVIFQMALFPPSESPADVWVATGRAYTNRYLQVIGTEEATTRLGPLRALHIRLGREGDELLDLWFGVDVKHLPVRIRWVRKDGSVNDFQAASIEYQLGKEKVKLEPPPEPAKPLG